MSLNPEQEYVLLRLDSAVEECLDAGVPARRMLEKLEECVYARYLDETGNPALSNANMVLDLAGIKRPTGKPLPPPKDLGCTCGHPGLGCMCVRRYGV